MSFISSRVKNEYYTYIVGSSSGTLYAGVTSDIQRRMFEHKNGLYAGFTKKYKCNKLLYYEVFSDIEEAIRREKIIKGWKRFKKESLIKINNPGWKDLAHDWFN